MHGSEGGPLSSEIRVPTQDGWHDGHEYAFLSMDNSKERVIARCPLHSSVGPAYGRASTLIMAKLFGGMRLGTKCFFSRDQPKDRVRA